MGTGTIHLAVTSKWRWKGVDLGKQDKAQTCVKKNTCCVQCSQEMSSDVVMENSENFISCNEREPCCN